MVSKLVPPLNIVPPSNVVADKVPFTVKPLTWLIVAVNAEPTLSFIVNVLLSSYVNPVTKVFKSVGNDTSILLTSPIGVTVVLVPPERVLKLSVVPVLSLNI